MTWKHLKTVRIVISLLFFFSFCAIYLDIFDTIPPLTAVVLTSTQLIPSIARMLVYTGAVSAGLVVTILLTALFGRVYCSGLCPLGTYQDFIIRLSRWEKKRRWERYRKPDFSLHYAVTAFVLFSIFAGTMVLLNLLEPFSNFGRMVASLIKPLVIYLNNTASFLLGQLDLFILFPVPYQKVVLPVLTTVILFAAVVTYLSYNHGRLFCNLLCPAGALLGIMSRFSIFRIVINTDSCTHCKLCEKVCKASCIDSSRQSIDFAACVGCFNCMEACHTDGVVYQPFWKARPKESVEPVDAKRREMLGAVAVVGMTVITPFAGAAEGTSGFEESKKHAVTPPGSISTEHFSSFCTACQLCVSSCPTTVLQPAFLKYGFAGLLQPEMDYEKSFCNYDCTICSAVCPSGAITPLTLEEKKVVQMGRAKFFRDDCIVITKKKDCGACSEHCPTKAVNMVLTDGVFLPVVEESICTGCGACEHACPTKPRKAIYVDSNAIHLRAEKPKIKKNQPKVEQIEEFPF